MLKHACIYLNKQSSEYAKILNVSDAGKTEGNTVQITEQLLRQRCIKNTVKHLRWSILQNFFKIATRNFL